MSMWVETCLLQWKREGFHDRTSQLTASNDREGVHGRDLGPPSLSLNSHHAFNQATLTRRY